MKQGVLTNGRVQVRRQIVIHTAHNSACWCRCWLLLLQPAAAAAAALLRRSCSLKAWRGTWWQQHGALETGKTLPQQQQAASRQHVRQSQQLRKEHGAGRRAAGAWRQQAADREANQNCCMRKSRAAPQQAAPAVAAVHSAPGLAALAWRPAPASSAPCRQQHRQQHRHACSDSRLGSSPPHPPVLLCRMY
jgi:hypothetical protein